MTQMSAAAESAEEAAKSSWWSPKRAAILIGFALTAIGALGPQIYVSPIEQLAAEASINARTIAGRIENLRASQSQYLLFEQIGALVYALDTAGVAAAASSQRETLRGLVQLSLVDRASPMFQILGELALAKKIVYLEESDRYQALIAAARKDVSLPAYQAVDNFETTTMQQANEWMGSLQKFSIAAETGKTQLESLASQRKLHLLVLMTIGSALLLAANLMSEPS